MNSFLGLVSYTCYSVCAGLDANPAGDRPAEEPMFMELILSESRCCD